MEMNYDVIIIGGGASGLFACAELHGKKVAIALLESNERVGKKLIATGNGKCNLTNLDMNFIHYNCPHFVEDFLNRYGAVETIMSFEKMGLLTKVIDKRVYPYSETSANVLDVLRKRLCDNIQVLTQHTVDQIFEKDGLFEVCGYTTEKGKKVGTFSLSAKYVVLATGSFASFGRDSLSLYGKLGHKIKTPRPSLVPIKTEKEAIKGLSGVRVKAGVRLGYRYEIGEVLFKDFGVSGIAVFNMSNEIARGNAQTEKIIIDFMPESSIAEVETMLRKRGANTVGDLLVGTFHTKVVDRIMWYAKCEVYDNANDKISAIASAIKTYPLKITGLGDASLAQVVSGGLSFEEFDQNLMSTIVPNLYAMGEALDIDGDCGGYNLQWAWTSAKVCTEGILKKLNDK
ncbi:MAG: aminoacetone oxidase family FAD-binding enzyme [Clostridia bacterium]|nr:aminoacetone oxidase family FAD-binding enzyme [Clostridia bacterium]